MRNKLKVGLPIVADQKGVRMKDKTDANTVRQAPTFEQIVRLMTLAKVDEASAKAAIHQAESEGILIEIGQDWRIYGR